MRPEKMTNSHPSPLKFHDKHTLVHVYGALIAAGAEDGTYSDGTSVILDRPYVAREIEEILTELASRRKPASSYDYWFKEEVKKREAGGRKNSSGGRPRDAAFATAIHRLVDLFICALGGQLEPPEVASGSNSHFPKFAATALAPLYARDTEGNLTLRVAKYWERERKKMTPIQSVDSSSQQKKVLSPMNNHGRKSMSAATSELQTCLKSTVPTCWPRLQALQRPPPRPPRTRS